MYTNQQWTKQAVREKEKEKKKEKKIPGSEPMKFQSS
jgi:hypothetical protein